jgi:hypothetical protein
LHVQEVTGACATRYQGTVALDRPALDIGIAAEQPRTGDEYELAVSYKQDIYNVALREIDRRKGVSRELPRRPMTGC